MLAEMLVHDKNKGQLMKYFIFWILLLISCVSSTILRQTESNNSIIVLQVRFTSGMMNGNGGFLTIKNAKTNEILKTQFRYTFSDFIVIPNVPMGTYKVEELFVIAGSQSTNFSVKGESMYFNNIEITEPAIYYLGKYLIKKIPPLFQLQVSVDKQPDSDSIRILKEVKEPTKSWQALKIKNENKLFKNDKTEFRVR